MVAMLAVWCGGGWWWVYAVVQKLWTEGRSANNGVARKYLGCDKRASVASRRGEQNGGRAGRGLRADRQAGSAVC